MLPAQKRITRSAIIRRIFLLLCFSIPLSIVSNNVVAFEINSSISEPVHENITRFGLSMESRLFVTDTVLADIVSGNRSVDEDSLDDLVRLDFNHDQHFDNCSFEESVETINARYDEILNALSGSFPDYAAASNLFGKLLHTAQDFYAHSNWVELGNTALFDSSMHRWERPLPFTQRGDSFILQGATPDRYVLTREGPIVRVFNPYGQLLGLGLVSGMAYSASGCPEEVGIGHWDGGEGLMPPNVPLGSRGLNKDHAGRPNYTEAFQQAVRQTTHEWCRLLELTYERYSVEGARNLFNAWVVGDQDRNSPEAQLRITAGAQACLRLSFALIPPQSPTSTPVPTGEFVCRAETPVNPAALDWHTFTPEGWSFYARESAEEGFPVVFVAPGSPPGFADTITFEVSEQDPLHTLIPCVGCKDRRAIEGPTAFGSIGRAGSTTPVPPSPCEYLTDSYVAQEFFETPDQLVDYTVLLGTQEIGGVTWRLFQGTNAISYIHTTALAQIGGVAFAVTYTGNYNVIEESRVRQAEAFVPAIEAFTAAILASTAPVTLPTAVPVATSIRQITSPEECALTYGDTISVATEAAVVGALFLEALNDYANGDQENPSPEVLERVNQLDALSGLYCHFEHNFVGTEGDYARFAISSDTYDISGLGVEIYFIEANEGAPKLEGSVRAQAEEAEQVLRLNYTGLHRIIVYFPPGVDGTINNRDYTLSMELVSGTVPSGDALQIVQPTAVISAMPQEPVLLAAATPVGTEIPIIESSATIASEIVITSTEVPGIPGVSLEVPSDSVEVVDTPSATPASCPGLLTSRMVIGEFGRVTPGDPNNVRPNPSTEVSAIGQIPGSAQFVVLAGPTCDSRYAWWQVNYQGLIGWTVEATNSEYWLEPVLSVRLEAMPDSCVVQFDGNTNRRTGPGTDYAVAGQSIAGQQSEVVAYAISAASFRWWKLADSSWVRADVVQTIGNCDSVPLDG